MGNQTTALARRVVSSRTQVITPAGRTVKVDYAQDILDTYQFISSAALKVGTHIVAASGAGKSTLLSDFAFFQLRQNKSGVILDPTGGVVDQLFAKIIRLPPEEQAPLWQRIVYMLSGNKESVLPSQLYYRISDHDTLFEIANRFPSVLKRQDPHLQEAPILGWNPLHECAIHAGKIAAALVQQVDFVADLIDNPGKYKVQLRQVLADHPALQADVDYFRRLMDPTSSGLREKKTGSLKNKLLPILADPLRTATYAATTNRLDWVKLLNRRKIIVIDYREELDPEHLQFAMIWHLKGFMDAIKHRGMAGRGHEVMLILDEITAMLGQRTDDGRSILAEDLQELIGRLGRNDGVNTVIAHQGLYQLDTRIQEVLMGMGNQIVGQLSSPDDAVRVARQFMRYNPYLRKKTENVYFTQHSPPLVPEYGYSVSVPVVIDERTVEFTPEEQLLGWVNTIMDLDRYQFYAQIATGEGGKKGRVRKITIAHPDGTQYPKEEILARLRRDLARRDGIPVEKLLAEINAPRIAATPERKEKTTRQPANEPATMEKGHDTPHTPRTQPVSQSGTSAPNTTRASAGASGSPDTGDFWEPDEAPATVN